MEKSTQRVLVVGGLAIGVTGLFMLFSKMAKAAPGPSPSPAPCKNWAPTSDPEATQIAVALLNGHGPVPYASGQTYYTTLNGKRWRFRMGRGVTNPGEGVATDLCVSDQV